MTKHSKPTKFGLRRMFFEAKVEAKIKAIG